MKIAVLLQCHKNPEQINLLLNALKHPAIDIFIHVDKKSNIISDITQRDGVFILPEEYRIDIRWGTISQVDASLQLIRNAYKHDEYDFYWLCSGQDFPIKPLEKIIQWFERHKGVDCINLFTSKNNGLGIENNYDKRNAIYFPRLILGNGLLRRALKRLLIEISGGYYNTYKWFRRKSLISLPFFYGSSWICFSKPTMQWILDYLDEHPEYYSFFRNSNCPDESFFHTLVMNSPCSIKHRDYLHFIDWTDCTNSPRVLTIKDKDKIKQSDKFMARKIDITVDKGIIDFLVNYMSLDK